MDLPEKAVVDATVAIKWLVPSDQSDLARRFWNRKLSAPDTIVAETVNALWKYVAKFELTADEARRAASFFPDDAMTLMPSQPLMQRALDFALVLRVPVYSCLYLATAWLLERPLITADTDLVKRVGAAETERSTLPAVLPLGMFAL
jgi:predicted nucleic acid-binding protein